MCKYESAEPTRLSVNSVLRGHSREYLYSSTIKVFATSKVFFLRLPCHDTLSLPLDRRGTMIGSWLHLQAFMFLTLLSSTSQVDITLSFLYRNGLDPSGPHTRSRFMYSCDDIPPVGVKAFECAFDLMLMKEKRCLRSHLLEKRVLSTPSALR